MIGKRKISLEEIALTGLAPSALIESKTMSLPRSPGHLIADLAETLVSKGRPTWRISSTMTPATVLSRRCI